MWGLLGLYSFPMGTQESVIVQDRVTGHVWGLLRVAGQEAAQLLAGQAAAITRVLAAAGLSESELESARSEACTNYVKLTVVREAAAEPASDLSLIEELESVLAQRRESSTDKSYTKSLLAAGPGRIGAKLREEAGELAEAIAHESDERVCNEAADVVYHLLVGLQYRKLDWGSVLGVLAGRFGRSGHVEKAGRS